MNDCFRRILVVRARSGEGLFTMLLQTNDWLSRTAAEGLASRIIRSARRDRKRLNATAS